MVYNCTNMATVGGHQRVNTQCVTETRWRNVVHPAWTVDTINTQSLSDTDRSWQRPAVVVSVNIAFDVTYW